MQRRQTEKQIDFVKSTFEQALKAKLDLTKVSAPIAVLDGTGINDDLNGIEREVGFPVKFLDDQKAVVVNSLAKWKRLRLKDYSFEPETGLVTDMRAIRPDEDYSPIHSVYVDQWDWEKVMPQESRSIGFLQREVNKIYAALKDTDVEVAREIGRKTILPEEIHFICTESLLEKYPTLTSKEREQAICKEYGAVFLMGIGGKLSHGEKHDGRAPDYDDWSTDTDDIKGKGLNGDLLVWNPALEMSFELSSMGIRVDKVALERQLEIEGEQRRAELAFHKMLLADELPQTIGGGIGQSRVAMFMLQKKHIGEVQVSLWPESVREQAVLDGIQML